MSSMKTTKSLKQLSQICALLLLVSSVSGCTSLAYYSQAVSGHLALMFSGEPVEDLLADPDTPEPLRHKLQLATEAIRFASQQMELPAGEAFTDYVELDRPWVLVNLVVVPEFSLTPRQWCYPFAGCQAYRGFFDTGTARKEQAGYQQEGYDTFLAGVTAYSTLGWFDDPLHTGFTRLPDWQMAALMFHELAHRVLYIPGDTAFNESFATAVELEGLRLWLISRGDTDSYLLALDRLRRLEQTRQLVDTASARLERLYARSDALEPEILRQHKADIFGQLADDYRKLTTGWAEPGPLGKDPEPLNNALLALFRQYRQHVPAFRQLLRDSGHRFGDFYEAARQLGEQPEQARVEALSALAERFEEDF
ncbi:aminopeptidase [Marinobacter sp.]|uniref:aminopeptidase n=1 Tax=Marinobacter sp. TaxID=50741 RepID=UPI0025BC7B18|nr:aminopeptidase [Marinobacter sp.]